MSMTPYHDGRVLVWQGDCLDILRHLSPNSVDSIVTDPPYGLGFMGKAWDELPPGEEWARECLRVLKPGGHMLAFGGTRTWHRLAVAVEDAGFEVRDSIAWLYGSGFPKSLDVSKAIDKAAGAERQVVGEQPDRWTNKGSVLNFANDRPQASIPIVGGPATPDAERWQGWGTALKPAFEPIVVARKPLAGTVAQNVLAHGTGALNIDGCRVGLTSTRRSNTAEMGYHGGNLADAYETGSTAGRWPANVALDESQAAALDEQSGTLKSGANPAVRGGDTDKRTVYGGFTGGRNEQPRRGTDTGGASRFFYVAKAPKKERPVVDGIAHPTVKPLALMRWLVRLVTPPGGLVLEPFAGSGTTVEACVAEGFRCLAIEREDTYLPLIAARMERTTYPETSGSDTPGSEDVA